jgi:hypothetical protein
MPWGYQVEAFASEEKLRFRDGSTMPWGIKPSTTSMGIPRFHGGIKPSTTQPPLSPWD